MPRGPTTSAGLGLGPEAERRLLEGARRGDRRALERLLVLLSGPVLRYGRAFCGNEPDAEDVSQVVLEAVTRRLPAFRGQSALTTWAYVVARNACRRRLRRERRAGVHLESLEAAGQRGYEVHDPGGDPATLAEERELGHMLDRAIATLPPSRREVLILRDVEGLRAREVARVLGLDVAAVKSRLHRARAALRQALAPETAWVDRRKRGRRKPGCPDTAGMISRFLEGDIAPGACARLEAHVAECPDCRATCEGMSRALELCRAADRRTPRAHRTRSEKLAARQIPRRRS